MKICPACSREYPSSSTHCESDGVGLVALQTGAEEQPEQLIGQIVDGRYRVERLIGRGGMGFVYAVRHVVVGKPFALKVLRLGVEKSEGVLQRFIREAQTASAVRSRHITETVDFGQLPNGFFYVVMELLEGMTLTTAMKEMRLSREQCLHVFIQMAQALALVHEQGIVHRDLKPDNVFLVHENGDPLFVKLLDFGIAKVMHAEASGLTETGVILGTPYYMSPEQARGEKLDHRTDIYALGVMMYRAFTGKLPFVAESMIGVLTRHLTEAPEPPSASTHIDVRTEHVILRCMEKSADRRFQTMSEVAAALTAIAMDPSGTAAYAAGGQSPAGANLSSTVVMDPQSYAASSRSGRSYQGTGAIAGAVGFDANGRPASVPPTLTSAPSHTTSGARPVSYVGTGSMPSPIVAAAQGAPSGAYAAVGPSVPSGAYPAVGTGAPSGSFPAAGQAAPSGAYPNAAYGVAPPVPEASTQRGLATSDSGSINIQPKRSSGVALGVPIGVLLALSLAAVGFLLGRGGRESGPASSAASGPVSASVSVSVSVSASVSVSVSAPVSASASAEPSPEPSTSSSAEPKGSRPPQVRYVPGTRGAPTAQPTTTAREKRPEIRSPFE